MQKSGQIQEPGQLFRTILPSLVFLAAVMIGVLPFGLDAGYSLIPQFMCMALIYVIVVRGGVLPSVVVFSAGLLADVLLAAPLGYWAMMFLLTLAATQAATGVFHRPMLQIAIISLILFLLAMAGWITAALYILQEVAWRPFLTGAGAAAISIVILSVLLDRFRYGLAPGPVSNQVL